MFRRIRVALPLFVLACLAVVAFSGAPPVVGQDKKAKDKDTKEEITLRNQLTKAEKQIAALQAEIREGKALVATLQAELKKEKVNDVAENKVIQSLSAQLLGIRGAKYVHTSTWKKKSDTTEDELQAFLTDVPTILGANKWVRVAWAGKPSTTTADFDALVVLVFEDAAASEKHKLDPQGKRFHDKYDKKFETPKSLEMSVSK